MCTTETTLCLYMHTTWVHHTKCLVSSIIPLHTFSSKKFGTPGRFRYFYRPQRSCGKVIFLQACVILFTGEVSVPASTTGHMTGGSLSGGGGFSVQGVSVWESLCPGGSLSRKGFSVREIPRSYGNEQALRILLECILLQYLFLPNELKEETRISLDKIRTYLWPKHNLELFEVLKL